MSDEWQAYAQDSRTICKYGQKCYQKNPEHHATYKHPPRREKNFHKRTKHRLQPYSNDAKQNKLEAKKELDSKTDNDKGNKLDPVASTVAEVEECKQLNEPEHKIILPEEISYYDKNTDHKILKELYLVEMPVDFYKFFEFLSENNESIEKTLASVNLELIGPYELLIGKLPILDNKELYLIHWRFFYDPPEFQAVLKKKGASQYHIGYYRDEQDANPVFLASNDSAKDYHISPMAENIFGAVYLYLQNEKNSPFTAVACQKLMNRIKKNAEDNNVSLEKYEMKKRLSQVITKTFHGAGITFPYNKKTELGYRRLAETDANLKKLFQKLEKAETQAEKEKVLSELQPVITFATIAVDECDFGTGLEAGIDLFCSGLKELTQSALSSLTAVYTLLNREPFNKIIKVHLKHRRRGPHMSILSLREK